MTPLEKTLVTILTGQLGAGQTMLRHRVLCQDHAKRHAVIVDGFGDVGFDHKSNGAAA